MMHIPDGTSESSDSSGRTISDPVFGPMRWEHGWRGQANIPGLGLADVYVEPADEEYDLAPPTGQRRAFELFLQDAQRLIAEAKRRALRVWEHEYAPVGGWGAKLTNRLKRLEGLNKLDVLLTSPTVTIACDAEETHRVVVSWACEWDPEHGYEVGFADGRIVAVD